MKINFYTRKSCLKAIIRDSKQAICLKCGSDANITEGCWTQDNTPSSACDVLGFNMKLWNIANDLRLDNVQKTLCGACSYGHHFANTLTIFKKYGVK